MTRLNMKEVCMFMTVIKCHSLNFDMCNANAFSPQGVTFDHASIFDVLGAL